MNKTLTQFCETPLHIPHHTWGDCVLCLSLLILCKLAGCLSLGIFQQKWNPEGECRHQLLPLSKLRSQMALLGLGVVLHKVFRLELNTSETLARVFLDAW